MKKFLQIGATTCIVGLGVWFALFFAGGIFTLFGEGDYERFRTFSTIAIVVGIIAALFWAWRRIRGAPVRIPEWGLLVFAALSLSGLTQHVVSDEAHEFLAFDPLVAVQRDVPVEPGDNFTFLGTTSMGVRVYSVERGGKTLWVVGVFPRFKLWWTNAFSVDPDDYERMERSGTLDKPQK